MFCSDVKSVLARVKPAKFQAPTSKLYLVTQSLCRRLHFLNNSNNLFFTELMKCEVNYESKTVPIRGPHHRGRCYSVHILSMSVKVATYANTVKTAWMLLTPKILYCDVAFVADLSKVLLLHQPAASEGVKTQPSVLSHTDEQK